MRKNKFFIVSSFLLLILAFGIMPLFAGDADRVGTAAGVQVLVPVGARDLALGGSDVATTSGLNAIYWNPAGFSIMPSRALAQFSTMNIFNDIRVNYLAVGVAAGRFGSFGVSLKAFDFGDIPLTTVEDMDGASGRTFSPTFTTMGVTYARRLTDAIRVGVTGKVIYESIPRASASAFAVDMGIQYENLGHINGLSIGLVVKNIGTNMKYSGSGLLNQAQEQNSSFYDFRSREASSDQLPSTVELGLTYRRNITETSDLVLAGVFQNNNFDNDRYKFGLEYVFNDLIALRGGYQFNQGVELENTLYGLTLGLGLHLKVGGSSLWFDYTYRDSQYFNGNNLFSFQVGF